MNESLRRLSSSSQAMASRSNNIPIPSASTQRDRNIEDLISMPFSSSPSVTRTNRLSGHGQGMGRRGSTSGGPGVAMGAGMSPTRPTSRSFTIGISPRANRSQTTTQTQMFEPRVIRAGSTSIPTIATATGAAAAAAVDCLPSSSTTGNLSTSPTRARRTSTTPSATRHASSVIPSSSTSPDPQNANSNTSAIAFPRPAYLNHSALRHFLHTDATPTLPVARTPTSGELLSFFVRGASSRNASLSPRMGMEDSDEDSDGGVGMTIPSGTTNREAREADLKLPTRWSERIRHPSLSVSPDGRELTFNGPSSNGDKEAAAARTDHPIPPSCGIYYYEVSIVSKGQKGHISIGFAGGDVKLSRLPGWERTSWGYHGDDGSSFAAEKNGTPYGPKYGTGDVVGCGIDFSTNRAFYTKNGSLLGPVFQQVGLPGTHIYPSVGLRHDGEQIRVNFGHEPFKFDIEDHVLQARNLTWAGIMSTPLRKEFDTEESGAGGGKGKINELVLSYLSHHGYAKTAKAFQSQCERRGGLISGGVGDEEAPIPVPPPPVNSHGHEVDMDMDMELASPTKTLATTNTSTKSSASASDGRGLGIHTNDIELRTQIVNSVIKGDIDIALREMERFYPKVLQVESGVMLFKLRCRKFVELILEAAELKKAMTRETATNEMDIDVEEEEEEVVEAGTNGYGGSESGIGGGGSAAIPIKAKRKQSFSSPHHPSSSHSALAAQYESTLSSAISYGQTLQSDYKTDSRPEVRGIFKKTFGIVAYEDPLGAGGEVAEVAGHAARVRLATELNQEILRSQGRPIHPTLERLYRQTAACIVQLGMLGVGSAAFADMPKEFLDA